LPLAGLVADKTGDGSPVPKLCTQTHINHNIIYYTRNNIYTTDTRHTSIQKECISAYIHNSHSHRVIQHIYVKERHRHAKKQMCEPLAQRVYLCHHQPFCPLSIVTILLMSVARNLFCSSMPLNRDLLILANCTIQDNAYTIPSLESLFKHVLVTHTLLDTGGSDEENISKNSRIIEPSSITPLQDEGTCTIVYHTGLLVHVQDNVLKASCLCKYEGIHSYHIIR